MTRIGFVYLNKSKFYHKYTVLFKTLHMVWMIYISLQKMYIFMVSEKNALGMLYVFVELFDKQEKVIPLHWFPLKKNVKFYTTVTVPRRPSVDWITLRVHGVGKNLALIFFIVTTSILVSKWPFGWGLSEYFHFTIFIE